MSSSSFDAFFILFIYFTPTLLALIWFIISLVMFKKVPQDHPKRRTRLVLVIVSACVAGCFLLLEGGLLALFLIGIKNM